MHSSQAAQYGSVARGLWITRHTEYHRFDSTFDRHSHRVVMIEWVAACVPCDSYWRNLIERTICKAKSRNDRWNGGRLHLVWAEWSAIHCRWLWSAQNTGVLILCWANRWRWHPYRSCRSLRLRSNERASAWSFGELQAIATMPKLDGVCVCHSFSFWRLSDGLVDCRLQFRINRKVLE